MGNGKITLSKHKNSNDSIWRLPHRFSRHFPICCALSSTHHLASESMLELNDLYGEKLMIVKRNDTRYIDLIRNEIEKNHMQITLIDIPYYDMNAFNQCENI